MLNTPAIEKRDLHEIYARHVNPEWVRLLRALGLNKRFVRAQGAELTTEDGTKYIDVLSGYGVYNTGHNHPRLIKELTEQMHSMSATMLQLQIPDLAGELAERLCKAAGGKLNKVYFGSSGSEGVDTALKFARAFTKRAGVLYSQGGFHGLSCGPLSLMSNVWWREGFEPLLPAIESVPFGELEALERLLKSERFAAFITEPIQGETGVKIPHNEYLKEASRLCSKYGTLLVIDEVQTGMYRTGKFLASHHFNIEPDMVVLAKALSGGFVPVSATLMRDDISRAVYSSPERSFVHASTFGENSMAMRAGLATMDVLEGEQLGARATLLGNRLRKAVIEGAKEYEMFGEFRGLGLMCGIEFTPPRSTSLKMLFNGFAKLHPGLFGQMCVATLFEKEKLLTQMSGNNYMVLKVLPALTCTEEQIDRIAAGFISLLKTVNTEKLRFWSHGMKIGARLVR